MNVMTMKKNLHGCLLETSLCCYCHASFSNKILFNHRQVIQVCNQALDEQGTGSSSIFSSYFGPPSSSADPIPPPPSLVDLIPSLPFSTHLIPAPPPS
jgi:hypothetical protein